MPDQTRGKISGAAGAELEKRAVSEVHVMVHPFFHPLTSPPEASMERGQVLEAVLGKVDGKFELADLEGVDPAVIDGLRRSELNLRYYMRKIDKVEATPDAVLIIMLDQYEDLISDAQFFNLSKEVYGPNLKRVEDRLDFQKRLIDYAAKLGDRLQIFDHVKIEESGSQIGEFIERISSNERGTIPLRVYGENLGTCPDDVARSLKESGFENVRLMSRWCLR